MTLLDELEACPVGATDTDPEALPWVVLFASVMHGTRAAVVARAREWRALFPNGSRRV